MLPGKGSDVDEGTGALFIGLSLDRKYVFALLSSVLIALVFTTFSSRFFIVFTGIVVAFFVSYVSKSKIGAVSGDVMGGF